jgi:hypothetical protein
MRRNLRKIGTNSVSAWGIHFGGQGRRGAARRVPPLRTGIERRAVKLIGVLSPTQSTEPSRKREMESAAPQQQKLDTSLVAGK